MNFFEVDLVAKIYMSRIKVDYKLHKEKELRRADYDRVIIYTADSTQVNDNTVYRHCSHLYSHRVLSNPIYCWACPDELLYPLIILAKSSEPNRVPDVLNRL